MIEVKLFICADSAAIDARTNAISAFHIAEQLNSPSFPVAVPRLAIIAIVVREATDPSSIQLQMQVHSGNQQLFSGPMAINFMQQLNARAVAEIHGLVIPAPGPLRLLLRNGDETLASWTVLINQVGQMPMQMFMAPAPISTQTQ